jgi:hypothetical protein
VGPRAKGTDFVIPLPLILRCGISIVSFRMSGIHRYGSFLNLTRVTLHARPEDSPPTIHLPALNIYTHNENCPLAHCHRHIEFRCSCSYRWGETVSLSSSQQGAYCPSTRVKKRPVPLPLCPPQIRYELTRARTRASTVKGRRLSGISSCLKVNFDAYYLQKFGSVFLFLW